MTDTLTRRQRQRCMSKNKGRDTGPELKLRKALWTEKLRYRTQYKITGKPDIVFVSKRIAIFVDGCFWHGCPEHKTQKPRTNANFWREKIEKNIARDNYVTETLIHDGWTVLRFWEHEVNQDLARVVKRVERVVLG